MQNARASEGASLPDQVRLWDDRLRLLAACAKVERETRRLAMDEDVRQVANELRGKIEGADRNWCAMVYFDGVAGPLANAMEAEHPWLKPPSGWERIRGRHRWLDALGEWGRTVVRSTFAMRVIGEPWPENALRPQEIDGWAMPPGEPRVWWKLANGTAPLVGRTPIEPSPTPDPAFVDHVVLPAIGPRLSWLLESREQRRRDVATTLRLMRGEKVESPPRRGDVPKRALPLIARRIVLGESYSDLVKHLARSDVAVSEQAIQKVLAPEAQRLAVDLTIH